MEFNGTDYKLNVIPSPHSFNDWQFAPTIDPASIPDEIDLKPWFSYDQGMQGSCTGHSQAKLMRLITKHQGLPDKDFSRAFIYKNSRILDGWPNNDNGSTILNSVKSLADYGACAESLMPYNQNDFVATPSQAAYNDGQNHQALKYEVVSQNIDVIRAALAQGLAVSFGFVVYDNFRPDGNGVIPMPSGATRGAHNMCLTGGMHSQRMFIGDNSWSDFWGRSFNGSSGGRCLIPYDFILNPWITFEMRTINLIEGTPTPPPPTRFVDGFGASLRSGRVIHMWPTQEFPIDDPIRGVGIHYSDGFATEIWHE